MPLPDMCHRTVHCLIRTGTKASKVYRVYSNAFVEGSTASSIPQVSGRGFGRTSSGSAARTTGAAPQQQQAASLSARAPAPQPVTAAVVRSQPASAAWRRSVRLTAFFGSACFGSGIGKTV